MTISAQKFDQAKLVAGIRLRPAADPDWAVAVTFVGELNPLGGPPLDHRQAGRSGSRLMVVLGLTEGAYLASTRVNLCRGRWDRLGASREAGRVLAGSSGRVLVLLGRRVASAFKVQADFFSVVSLGGSVAAVLPHPSGLCRVWNDRRAWAKARRCLTLALKRVGRADHADPVK